MDGLLLVDKPAGWTSHDAVMYLRGVLRERRTGHTGTLDPDATGLLVVLLGKATRLARYFEADEKTYLAVMKLGERTDTLDASGEVVARCPVPELEPGSLREVFGVFTGEIEQVPPMYSAVKQGGTPLYKKARAGVEVERSARKVTVHSIDLVEISPPLVTFRVRCSKGLYVRTLCEDIGEALGSCAHLSSLRRLTVGGYEVADALYIGEKPGPDAAAAGVIPLDRMLARLPGLVVSPDGAKGVAHGRVPQGADIVSFPDGDTTKGSVRVLDGEGGLLAIAEKEAGPGGALRLKVVLA